MTSHPVHRVTSFERVGAHVLRVEFGDGSRQTIDFTPVLAGELYGPLRDPDLFGQVKLDPEVHTLVWPNGADFDPATLHDWPSIVEELTARARVWHSAPNIQQHPMFGNVRQLETEIGIAPGFLERLLKEGDDWSFIIKLNALAEAALTHLLTATVGRKELSTLFSALSMADGKKGKLAVASRLHLIDSRRKSFFLALGRIRNRFAHDPKHVGLRIENFVESLSPGERSQFWKDLIGGYTMEPVIIDFEGREIPAEEFARLHPRFTIWIACMGALSLIYRAKTLDDAARQQFHDELSSMKPLRGPIRRQKS